MIEPEGSRLLWPGAHFSHLVRLLEIATCAT